MLIFLSKCSLIVIFLSKWSLIVISCSKRKLVLLRYFPPPCFLVCCRMWFWIKNSESSSRKLINYFCLYYMKRLAYTLAHCSSILLCISALLHNLRDLLSKLSFSTRATFLFPARRNRRLWTSTKRMRTHCLEGIRM